MIDAAKIKALREQTGISFAQCKEALESAAGDIDKALAWLKEKGAAIAEKKAGLWDMTRTLVTSLLLMLWGISWGLGYALYEATHKDEPNGMVLTALLGLAGPIWTGAIVASVVAIVAYRFDGNKDGSEQTKAVLDLAARGGIDVR